MTLGGSRSFCDQLVPNPFLGVAGFEGTNRFTSPTLSRFELARPFPAFSGGMNETERNDGRMTYDSAQLVANKRRITASGVWEIPWMRNRTDLLGRLAGGWSIAPMFIFQSGQPWDVPDNVDLAVDPSRIALTPEKNGQFIYGVQPCVGQPRPPGCGCRARQPQPVSDTVGVSS